MTEWVPLLVEACAAMGAAPGSTTPAQPVIAVGWFARMLAAVWVGVLPLGRHAPPSLRLMVAAALGVVALPTVVSTARVDGTLDEPLRVIVSEVLVGLGLGLVPACILAAAAWAGAVVGSVAGLSWSGDFTVAGEDDAAGTARLAWWCGVAAFFAAGGHRAVVGGLLDTAQLIPVGTAAGGATGMTALATVVSATPGLAFSLAAAVALPALTALVTFHVSVAICLRTTGFAPGGGLLQAAAALLFIATLIAGGEIWLGGFGTAASELVARGYTSTSAGP